MDDHQIDHEAATIADPPRLQSRLPASQGEPRAPLLRPVGGSPSTPPSRKLAAVAGFAWNGSAPGSGRSAVPVLPLDVRQDVERLCAEGDALAAAGTYEGAIERYSRAYMKIPEPQNQFEATTALLASFGDLCYFGGYFQLGHEALHYALSCPDGSECPLIHLRLGQCAFEQGQLDRAFEALVCAYEIGGGEDIFLQEDPKYFCFLAGRSATACGNDG